MFTSMGCSKSFFVVMSFLTGNVWSCLFVLWSMKHIMMKVRGGVRGKGGGKGEMVKL